VALRLSHCTVYYNEMDLDAESLLIINKLSVVGIVERSINTSKTKHLCKPFFRLLLTDVLEKN